MLPDKENMGAHIRVRMARAEDYKAVMDINRHVYADLDYLPSHYFLFLHDPDVYMWVAETGGKIVGFSAAYLIEGRTVACQIAARVHPEYQRLGINALLIETKHSQLRRILPNGYYDRMVQVQHPNLHLADGSHKKTHLSIVGQYHHMMYNVSPDRLTQGLQKMKAHSISKPKSFHVEKTITILQSETTMSFLRTSSDFVTAHANWLPMKVTRDNLARLAKECSTYFTMEDTQCQAVSFCDVTLNPDHSIRIQIDYFGLHDVLTFVSHVTAYMHDVRKKCGHATEFRIRLIHPPIRLDLAYELHVHWIQTI